MFMKLEAEDITTAYGEALVEVGKFYPNIIVLNSDIADSCKTEAFLRAFPERSFVFFLAEQSLPTIAAGLSLVGKIPFYNSFAVFAVSRGVDMIRQSIAYNDANVKIVGHGAGQSMGYTGPSHHTLEDISILRAIPNITILSPCDAVETTQIVWKMAETEGPMYLRLARAAVPNFHKENYKFEIGRTELLKDGTDITIFVTGDMVVLAMEVHDIFASQGISCKIVNVPTIKPINVEEIIKHGQGTLGALTIEDHNILGGLGSTIAEIYAEFLQKPVKRLGIPDIFTESDDATVLRSEYGLNVDLAIKLAREIL